MSVSLVSSQLTGSLRVQPTHSSTGEPLSQDPEFAMKIRNEISNCRLGQPFEYASTQANGCEQVATPDTCPYMNSVTMACGAMCPISLSTIKTNVEAPSGERPPL
ncbi:hypothetical protein AB1N83_010092 [Pleurotus pulmonarius]